MSAQQGRERRRETSLRLFAASDLFVAGLLILPAFLFNPSTVLRTAQFLLFWLYAVLLGRRNSALATLTVSLGIVLFNLLVPYGRVLAAWGPLKLTAGALLAGIQKAVTLEGLLMLSKSAIRSDLRLPGSFGSLVGESFRIFESIMGRKSGIDWKDPIAGIDRLLLELSEEAETDGRGTPAGAAAREDPIGPRRAGRLILAAALLPAWLLFAANFLV